MHGPGADIRYTVTVQHTGTLGDADALLLTDDLDGNITTLSYLQWSAGSIEITAPDVGGGAPTALTDANDAEMQGNSTTRRAHGPSPWIAVA